MSKMKRKGGSVSIWIWIIGGLIIGVVTFTVAFTQLSHIVNQSFRQNVVSDFEKLNDEIGMVCGYSIGTKSEYTVELRDVMAIFANDTRGEAPNDAPNKILNGESGSGEYICMTFYDQHYRCEDHFCEIEMDYIGDPPQDTTMYNVGIQDGKFTYELEIEKVEDRKVEVKATHVP